LPAKTSRRSLTDTIGTPPQELAELFGITTKTVRRRIAEGTLPAFRVGRQIRIDVTAAEDALMRPMNAAAAALISARRRSRSTR
ncbi:helix-turn-helix domain-containing protein, partial [Tessaracoccus lubricantis]